jgi:hypothetical protein
MIDEFSPQRLADDTHGTLNRLINLREQDDRPCIAIIAYHRALYLINTISNEKQNRHFKKYEECLEYLKTKNLNAKRNFDRLYVLSTFVKYGDVEIDNTETLKQINNLFSSDDFAKVIQAWLSYIERLLPSSI